VDISTTGTESTTTSRATGTVDQTPTYDKSVQYGYNKSQPSGGHVGELSETFRAVDISTNERPGPTRFASCDSSSNAVSGIK
jgi:hypothetical protein